MKGVRYIKSTGKWIAKYGNKHIGTFETEQQANEARRLAEPPPVETLKQIGARYGISAQRASLIHTGALDKLRNDPLLRQLARDLGYDA